MSKPVPKFRDISPTEISYINQDTEQHSYFVNQFFVEGEGEISEAQMKAAVELAFAANPGISLQLKGHWYKRYWALRPEAPLVKIYAGEWDGNSSQNKAVVDEPLNPRKDNLASITLFNQLPDQQFKILFRIHHGVCDGVATLHWIEEVFRALRGEKLLGSQANLSEMDIIKQEEYAPAENLLAESKPVFPLSDNSETRECHWIKYSWQQKDTKITAKLIYILKTLTEEQHGACRTTFRIPANLRRYLSKEAKQQAQLTNLSGLFDLKFDQQKVTVNDIQSAIIQAMRTKRDIAVFPKKLTALTRFLPGFLFHAKPKALKKMHEQGRYGITAMISFAGQIKLPNYCCEGFKATQVYGIPMPLEDKSIFIGLITDENHLFAVLSAPNALSTPAQTHALAQKIEAALQAL